MLRLLCIFSVPLLAFTAVLPAIAAEPFEGKWAEDPAWCSRSPQDAPTDERPVTVTAQEIDFYVSFCRIRNIRKNGGRFIVRSICEEEGQDDLAIPSMDVIEVADNRMRITNNRGSWEFERCQ